jgi:hypothetical protein
MSVIPSLAWINSATPDYITRAEVIDFASSVIQYISAGGLSTISFNVGPNPSFSTVQINPTGNIGMNGAALTNATSLGISSIGSLQARPWTTAQNAATVVAADGSGLEGLQAQTLIAKLTNGTVNNPGVYMDKTGLWGASNDTWTGSYTPGMTWLGSNGANQWVLQNVSTINGTPPNTTNTTFTTLTGNTLNSSNVNTNAVNNISSFNGAPVIAEMDTSYTMTTVNGLADNTFTVLTTINTPFTVPTDAAVLASVNIRIGSFASGSPPVFYGQFGLRIGGQGGGGGVFLFNSVAIPTNLTAGTTSFTISGICQTPTAATTNTIEVVAVNITGVAVTCQITSPVTPANIVYAKVLY